MTKIKYKEKQLSYKDLKKYIKHLKKELNMKENNNQLLRELLNITRFKYIIIKYKLYEEGHLYDWKENPL